MTAVIIPVYNAEKYLDSFLKKLPKGYEIIIIDDGSTDNSSEIAEASGFRVIKLDENYGKGRACRIGAMNAKSDDIIFIDGDDQFNPKEIEKFAIAIKNADLVIGQRDIKKIPFQRKITNRLSSYAVKKITGRRFDDVLCGLRAIKKEKLKMLELKEGYEFEADMVIKAAKNNFVIKTLPVEVNYKTGSRMPFFKGLKLGGYLFAESLKNLVN